MQKEKQLENCVQQLLSTYTQEKTALLSEHERQKALLQTKIQDIRADLQATKADFSNLSLKL